MCDQSKQGPSAFGEVFGESWAIPAETPSRNAEWKADIAELFLEHSSLFKIGFSFAIYSLNIILYCHNYTCFAKKSWTKERDFTRYKFFALYKSAYQLNFIDIYVYVGTNIAFSW